MVDRKRKVISISDDAEDIRYLLQSSTQATMQAMQEMMQILMQQNMQLYAKLKDMETHIEKITKEVSDLHGYALNGSISHSDEDPPYVHF